MIRAGSLFYALAISFIMAALAGSLLLVAGFNRLLRVTDQNEEELARNAESGIQFLMSAAVDYQAVDLFKNKKDSVFLQRKKWGAFTILYAKAVRKNNSSEQIVLSGVLPSEENNVLTLADLDRPLSVSGNTEIRGNCLLPKAGIERAYIEGESFTGSQLVHGSILQSERFLPDYNDTLCNYIKRLFGYSPSASDSCISLAEFSEQDSLSNSFKNDPLYLSEPTAVHITHQFVHGYICIISSKAIYVNRNAHLQDVLLIAPYIEIEAETEGRFQAFARDSLRTGKNIQLHYPSILALIADKQSSNRAFLHLGERSTVLGELFATSLANEYQKQVHVLIDKDAILYGKLYCNGTVDLKGAVYGELVCMKFELKTNSAIYENHLLHAVIDRSKRSSIFVQSAITANKNSKAAIITQLE
jgi:hypothetical protein